MPSSTRQADCKNRRQTEYQRMRRIGCLTRQMECENICWIVPEYFCSIIESLITEPVSEYMPEDIPGPKRDHMSQHMPDFTAMSENAPTRTSEHSLEPSPAFMIDDVPKHKSDLMPEQGQNIVHPHVRPCQAKYTCPAFFQIAVQF